MFSNDDALVSTRRAFVNKVAAAGGAALFGRLGISPVLAVEATGRSGRPLKAAFSNAGLQATWCAQGKRAAEHWGKLFNVDITWFDGELSPTRQRKAVDNMATQKWDFVAIQALTEGTLTDPVNKMIAGGIPVISIDTLIAPYEEVNGRGSVY
jgi:ribose transport system substrate-binding protein